MYYFKITDYAEELLNGLDELNDWPDAVKIMQKNWIGKSQGMEIIFPSEHLDCGVKIFTTRADTIMGVTYTAVSHEHPLTTEALKINPTLSNFIQECKQAGVS